MISSNDSAGRLQEVRERIARAAACAGRDAASVRLIAVSKTHQAAAIQQLIDCGVSDFGESRVQEAVEKTAHFSGRQLHWHFIGHLQSNKAHMMPGYFHWVHSIDTEKTAQRIAAAATPLGVCVKLLLQVNVAGDPAKHGVSEADLAGLADRIMSLDEPGIQLRGLMTIGQRGLEADRTRRDFARLRVLLEHCRERFGGQFSELSMGMSADYELAVEEGATMVRVGSALFGARN